MLSWGLKLLAGPIVFAIVYGGIDERQTNQNEFEREGFLGLIKKHVLRFMGANLFAVFMQYVVLIAAVAIAGEGSISGDNDLFLAILYSLFATLMLFWNSAMVVEGKLFRSLMHAIKTLLFNPMGLVIGVLWLVVCTADSVAFDSTSKQIPLAINLARSGVFAVLKTYAIMYVLGIYKNAWGEVIQKAQAVETMASPTPSRPGEKLAKASLGFTFFSFLPLVHLAALALGTLSLKRGQWFILKAAIGCWVGGFFTIPYALLVVGYIAG